MNTTPDDERDASLQRRAAQFLDAHSDTVDAPTRAALARARAAAGDQARRGAGPALAWGGGIGFALAASLVLVAVRPDGVSPVAPAGSGALDATLAAARADAEFAEVSSISDADAALAEDLAFIAWLEENHDAG